MSRFVRARVRVASAGAVHPPEMSLLTALENLFGWRLQIFRAHGAAGDQLNAPARPPPNRGRIFNRNHTKYSNQTRFQPAARSCTHGRLRLSFTGIDIK
jgi:hypothetical protein